ncbi:hypothetical protein QUA35_26935 [Microcoleus sp. N9_B2]|uniref:hypothetical protein n=1 Tax=unclassified Microcoleus TaxID=2642155 RepID=UPI002FD5A965
MGLSVAGISIGAQDGGFLTDCDSETGFFTKSVGYYASFGQKTRFLGPLPELTHCDSETGFFTESAGCNEVFCSKNPVSGPHP